LPTEFLRVFVGSAMNELRDVREIVEHALGERGISAFVYESAAGAQPETVVETSLRELRLSDVFVALFWQEYPKVTVVEFQEARTTGKPCFAYIRDKNRTRDSDLDRFLTSDIYDLTKGISYTFFDSALKLGGKIGDDIMSWLVRRNRELTAEVAAQRVSNDEIAKLQNEIHRLQVVSRDPLPHGTAADRLASDLRGWCAALGYGIEREIDRSDESFEWLMNIPERRRYTRVLVRGVEGEADLRQFRATQSSLERERADEAWLVSIRRVSQSVRDAAHKAGAQQRVYTYTFDELLDESANFDRYFEWLEAEVRRRGIDNSYVQLAAAKDEYEPGTNTYLGRARYGRQNGWLEGYVDRWLADPSKEHISILGEFGTGKTSFALHYAWVSLSRYRDAKKRGLERPRVPLVIPLRDYAKAVTVESLFSEFFFRKYEMLPGYSAFDQLNRMGKLLLIFDGFDEMAAKVDRQEMINNFWRLARVVVPGAKAILTCRTEHFPEAKEGRALLSAELKASTANLTGDPPQFEVLELERFDDGQIRELLGHHTTPETAEIIMGRPQLLDLARRPVMAGYILEALPDIKAGKPVDLARIYLYAVTRKMERDVESGRTFTSLADKLYFMCEISWEMLSTDTMSLNYRQFPDRLASLFGKAVKEQKDLDHWHFDMLGQSMLVRNAEGDYSPAHRSLLEFFVAYKFTAELGLLAEDCLGPAKKQSNVDGSLVPRAYRWSEYFQRHAEAAPPLMEFQAEEIRVLDTTFGRRQLAPAVAQLMDSMLRSDATAALLRIAAQTRSSITEGCTGGNAVTTALRRDRSALRGADFSGTRLDFAVLEDADLSGCDLRNASLRNALIRGGTLEGVRLEEAELLNFRIHETQGIRAVAVSPDGARYAAATMDGAIIVGEIGTGAEVFRIGTQKEEVAFVSWLPDSTHVLAGGGRLGWLAMWDVVEGKEIFFQNDAFKDWTVHGVWDAHRSRILAVGGLKSSALKAFDRNGRLIGRWEVPGDQTNRIALSIDGRYGVASYWYREIEHPGNADFGIVLFRCSDQGEICIINRVECPSWRVFFANTVNRVFATGENRHVVAIDVENGGSEELGIKGGPRCISADDELLVVDPVQQGTKLEAKLQLWHLPTCSKLAEVAFGQQLGNQPFRKLDAEFSPDGTMLIGGSDDGTVRMWDTRLFRALPAGGARARKRRSKITVPEGMERNPNFGKEIRVIKPKITCAGLRLNGAKGLASVQISGLSLENEEAVIEWFVARGAVRPTAAGDE
jgi:hypothetical protein